MESIRSGLGQFRADLLLHGQSAAQWSTSNHPRRRCRGAIALYKEILPEAPSECAALGGERIPSTHHPQPHRNSICCSRVNNRASWNCCRSRPIPLMLVNWLGAKTHLGYAEGHLICHNMAGSCRALQQPVCAAFVVNDAFLAQLRELVRQRAAVDAEVACQLGLVVGNGEGAGAGLLLLLR